ncbi:MAG TPA: SDR family oxidoreductase [Amycolatopsis sp.]|nr:SDR family oxidoreductase [Amycolatopsis sp.]
MSAPGFLDRRANLAGKVALIAGGGGGLGRAIALDFAGAGVHLWLCDRNAGLLAETAEMTAAAGVRVQTGCFDARDPEQLTPFFERVTAAEGHLDVLVNVVGGTFKQRFDEMRPKGWDALIRANFTWLLHSTHLAVPLLRNAANGASIINVTSIEAHRAAPNYSVYAAMKAAVTSFTRTVAVELAPERIRVNTIAPDRVPTERTYTRSDEERAASGWGDDPGGVLATRIGIPMRRRGTYEDIGSSALFLASDLSSYITGTSLHPDGGVSASAGWFDWPGTGLLNFPPPSVTDALLEQFPG